MNDTHPTMSDAHDLFDDAVAMRHDDLQAQILDAEREIDSSLAVIRAIRDDTAQEPQARLNAASMAYQLAVQARAMAKQELLDIGQTTGPAAH
jgi:hypothetical protein